MNTEPYTIIAPPPQPRYIAPIHRPKRPLDEKEIGHLPPFWRGLPAYTKGPRSKYMPK